MFPEKCSTSDQKSMRESRFLIFPRSWNSSVMVPCTFKTLERCWTRYVQDEAVRIITLFNILYEKKCIFSQTIVCHVFDRRNPPQGSSTCDFMLLRTFPLCLSWQFSDQVCCHLFLLVFCCCCCCFVCFYSLHFRACAESPLRFWFSLFSIHLLWIAFGYNFKINQFVCASCLVCHIQIDTLQLLKKEQKLIKTCLSEDLIGIAKKCKQY